MTYYVSSSSGDDGNSGTIVLPWETLSKVNSTVLNPGDIVLFKCGDTWTTGALNITYSGSVNSKITFASYDYGAKPIINGGVAVKAVIIDDTENIIISDLEVKGADHCIYIESSSKTGTILLNALTTHDPVGNNCISIENRSHVIINNCDIYNSPAGSGVYAFSSVAFTEISNAPCSNTYVIGCRIYDNYKNGIFIEGGSTYIYNNDIHDNGALLDTPSSHNIYYVGNNGVIKNNQIQDSPGGNGIYCAGSELNIYYNYVKNNYLNGIAVINNYDELLLTNGIYYNIIIGSSNLNYGILIAAIGDSGSSSGTFINNNNIMGSNNFIGLGLFEGISLKVKNNIIVTVGLSVKVSIEIADSSVSDNNCFHSDTVRNMYNPYDDIFISLLQWQNSGQDLHSTREDPLFISATPIAPEDFILKPRSFCIYGGDSEFASVNRDYFGKTVIGRPNIGVCESTLIEKKQTISDRFSRLNTFSGIKTKTIREIVETNYNNLLIGATIGGNVLSNSLGDLFNSEFSYSTPENDFKQGTVRAVHGSWDWSMADLWEQNNIDNNQVLRVHGPIGPQCSTWVMDDSRTGPELEAELLLWMQTLCERYNGKTGFDYLDVVNETIIDGLWHGPKPGTTDWQCPWTIIGYDTDPNATPLYIKKAFETAGTYAPNMKFIYNHHEAPNYTESWDLIKETVLYLRGLGLRVDGIGWQAHVTSTEEITFPTTVEKLQDLISWAHTNSLEFHITEFSSWLKYGTSTEQLVEQAETYRTILKALIEMRYSGIVAWNTWHVVDAYGWHPEWKAAVFDGTGVPKPAYFSVSHELELHRDK